ncbi:MAG: hypothetical protein LOY00_09025 [Methylocaldum sp.]|jgi:hypothetical protein|nr:hypothetical protein [Methylocaldum sp. RMAD-M]MDV3241899.1 hypothetical protein [Methylocaldum sp.]
MNSDRPTFYRSHRLGEKATHPIARRASCLAALLLIAGDYLAASSRPFDGAQDRPFDRAQDRLAIRPARRTLGRVQLPFLGLCA